MVSSSQSAFVKKRCIHDNFVLVQGIAKDLHRKKIPVLFIKLDIGFRFIVLGISPESFGKAWL
jgi:hypothetical protein